ncbi:hypothetical protein Tco_1352435 [Tanacetum coccineum]
MVNGFMVGTVIDVPFAENTIRDVIESIFYHHYVHDITEEEVAFNRPFSTYRDDRRWKPNELRLMKRKKEGEKRGFRDHPRNYGVEKFKTIHAKDDALEAIRGICGDFCVVEVVL